MAIFLHLGGVTRWHSQFLKYTWTFFAIICVASQLFLCFFWIHLWVKNRCLQHPCFKHLCKIAQASKNSNSNTQHFLSDLLTHSWFHFMLFALPGYQFPYTVINMCLYLTILGLSCWMNERHALVRGYAMILTRLKIETNFPKNGGLGFLESLLCWDSVTQAHGDNCHTFQLAVS
jgi:hypothetical protein